MSPGEIHAVLSEQLGPQRWWPADTPFEVMVGAVLTQNTAWTNVEKALGRLRRADMLTPEAIVGIDPAHLARLVRPSGYYRVKARRLRNLCTWLLEAGGVEALRRRPTPELRAGLLAVNGVGPETADAILVYALGRPQFVADAYARRVLGRIGAVQPDIGYEALRAHVEAAGRADARWLGEFHALLVAHGKNACRKTPRCAGCCLQARCAHARG